MKKRALHLSSWLLLAIAAVLVSACTRVLTSDAEPWSAESSSPTHQAAAGDAFDPDTTARPPGAPILSPTPDEAHTIPGLRTEPTEHVVRSGDTLGQLADRYGVSVEAIAEASNIADVNVLEVGQTLVIPVPNPVARGPAFKIIPDSELVAGPPTAYFDVADFVYAQDSYLLRYEEEVDEQVMAGYQIVQRIAQDYSLNPRLLLAVLEYQSGWVTRSEPREDTLSYPLGWEDPALEGLYRQLAWTANELNRGYYLWRVNGIGSWVLPDGVVVPVDPTINAGTAALQYFFSNLYTQEIWERTVGSEGVYAKYFQLFGYPFDYAHEPLLPDGLAQPSMQLPFEKDAVWAFTGGPHGGWGSGSAWAALDFAPHVEELGCASSDEWVTAMADGLVVRSANGAVVLDLDGDGLEQTGWTILYMHVEDRDRVEVGQALEAGDRLGHPSCTGGVSSGTHVHVARRYNGEWIPADQEIPYVLDGWVSVSTGESYEGVLQKGERTVVADNGATPENAIQR
jgi:murein DD-endopeptidase MepM/ murein hydrolase activator NlpD